MSAGTGKAEVVGGTDTGIGLYDDTVAVTWQVFDEIE